MATTTKPRTRKPAPQAEPTPEPEATEEQATEEQPKRTRVSAVAEAPKVLEVLKQAGEKGMSLKELAEATGHEYRVLHNITWRLEGGPATGTKVKDKGWEKLAHRTAGSRPVRWVAGPPPTA